jgi:hypothetical protein
VCRWSLVLVALFAVACAYGTDTTRAVNEPPLLVVSGAPEGATLFVDGIAFGAVEKYDAETPVEVLPGAHVVEIRQGGQILHREEIYAGTGSTVTISVAHLQ